MLYPLSHADRNAQPESSGLHMQHCHTVKFLRIYNSCSK